MKQNITINGTIKANDVPIMISFAEYPEACTQLVFQSGESCVALTSEALRCGAISAIAAIPAAFGITDEEMVIVLASDRWMHIASDGNHIRFTSSDVDSLGFEVAYWVCDEFEEDEEAESILGAIGGLLCS